MKKLIALTLLIVFCPACATISYQKKVLSSMTIGGTLGAIYGQTKSEQKKANSALYGGLFSALIGVVALYSFDRSNKVLELEETIRNLKLDLDRPNKLIESDFFTKERTLPKNLKGVIRLGGYDLFEKNKWSQIDERTLVFEQYVLRLKDNEIILNNK